MAWIWLSWDPLHPLRMALGCCCVQCLWGQREVMQLSPLPCPHSFLGHHYPQSFVCQVLLPSFSCLWFMGKLWIPRSTNCLQAALRAPLLQAAWGCWHPTEHCRQEARHYFSFFPYLKDKTWTDPLVALSALRHEGELTGETSLLCLLPVQRGR